MKNKTFSIFALLANNQIELKPIKRVFYKSKFIWPTIFGLCGIIVTLFNAFTRPYAALYFGPVEVQMYEATLFSALLLITSYPVTIRSFNQHMERHPQDGLGKNLVRFLRLFLLPALIFIGYLLYRNHLLG
ncbi:MULTISPECIES: hypothetical protein [unclassified Brenneria]|uniref:hypothetical protein n=1 Tax=unclassified Brenneria TaxID=2634434 RepID=UPI0029C5AC0A|nr:MULTISPECIES: hypothetical protein [unclassified Brenneria]MDX5629133.1 hypothetical protein [Brenneria sp. L3-3Z]MDX5696272.1 hypothetical protein [Brenneria sp. L4-2C]